MGPSPVTLLSTRGIFAYVIKELIAACRLLYNRLIWHVLKLAFFFKKVFSLYLFWRLEQSEQRHLYVDIFFMRS